MNILLKLIHFARVAFGLGPATSVFAPSASASPPQIPLKLILDTLLLAQHLAKELLH